MAPPNRRDDADEAFHRKVALLNALAADRLDDLLAELGVRTWRAGKVRVGPCPVHGGDRHNALNLYPDGHTVRGVWFCKTRECEKVFKKNLVGLVHGVLSRHECGWARPGDRTVPFDRARDWLCGFVGQRWADLRPDFVRADQARFVAGMRAFAPPGRPAGVSPADVAARLTVPSPYFLARVPGYHPDTLRRFLVGEPRAADPASPMSGRAVAPVLCPAGESVLGYTGRAVHEQCPACRVWHAPGPCPPAGRRGDARYAKWRHHGFSARDTLYGLHLARRAVQDRDEVVLVEGPGKVWRLHEAGAPNAVALFGVDLADPQQAAVEALPCGRVTLLMDPGPAGEAGAAAILRRFGRLFKTRVLVPPADPADMEADALKDFLESNPW